MSFYLCSIYNSSLNPKISLELFTRPFLDMTQLVHPSENIQHSDHVACHNSSIYCTLPLSIPAKYAHNHNGYIQEESRTKTFATTLKH